MFWFWCDVRFLSGRGEEQGWIIRLVSLDTLQCMEMSSPIYLRRRHFSYRGRKVGVVYDFRRRWEVFQISQEGGMGSWFQEKMGWVPDFRRRWDGILISGEGGMCYWFQENGDWFLISGEGGIRVPNFRRRWDGFLILGECGMGS